MRFNNQTNLQLGRALGRGLGSLAVSLRLACYYCYCISCYYYISVFQLLTKDAAQGASISLDVSRREYISH